MSRTLRIQFSQLLTIIVVWQVVAVLITLYDYFSFHTDSIQALSPSYSFGGALMFNLAAGLMGALLGGSFLVFYVNTKFRDRPYGYIILAVCVSFITIVAIITIVLGIPFVTMQTGKPFGDAETQQAYKNYMLNPIHVKNCIVWSVVVALTQLMLQFNNKFGHGILWSIITGKYHTPKEETRIFMFLDLNSSTTIAERLGSEQYHRLLKDFFADITDPIVNNRGEIYQYVGDEVVVAWHYDNGIANAQCVQCFFDMKEEIERRKETYLQRYGLVPSFKAGIHFGKVIAGEVGIIKRDITYSGDVLNTTSRIQSQCKVLNVEVLSSTDLLSKLTAFTNFETKRLGAIKLRGKETEVELSTILQISS